MTSSPFRPNTTVEDQLAYYKAQYEQLEHELHEFQASSKELEAELEKDVEESEKRERKLKEQVEGLGFEVDEWKTKCKQSRDEANRSQTALQKEVTTLRESQRTLQLSLRDIEVANDDYERQARNTTSSLEDLESKLNVSVERGVMLEEEIRQGDMEREQLRIETQRLRDELSDLRVEFDITVEKLHHTEAALERSHAKKVPMSMNPVRPRSPTSEVSAITPPSPSVSTPPAQKSEVSDMPTPPSPPLSDANGHNKPPPKTRFHSQALRPQPLPEAGSTPRPLKIGTRLPRHSRGPSLGGQGLSLMSTSNKMGPPPRTKPATSSAQAPAEALPRSQSLHQIKGLIGRMQKIEARVHSVRSKLPPPTTRTASPRNSPRGAGMSAATTDGGTPVPASVTVRSARKRTSNISALSNPAEHHDTTGISKRLSFGVLAGQDRPTSSSGRPSSRASNTSASEFARPGSRVGMSSIGEGASNGTSTMRTVRPRSSMGYAAATISEEGRRSTLDRSGIPAPGKRRESGATSATASSARRTSQAFVGRSMAPPPPRKAGIGETY